MTAPAFFLVKEGKDKPLKNEGLISFYCCPFLLDLFKISDF